MAGGVLVGVLGQSTLLSWALKRREEAMYLSMYFVPHEGDFKLKIVHISLQFDYVHVVIQFLCVLKTYGLHFLLNNLA